jgi:hypothetical protein
VRDEGVLPRFTRFGRLCALFPKVAYIKVVLRYVYFEKVRILDGKKKTPKRQRNEQENGSDVPLEDRRRVWVLARLESYNRLNEIMTN